MLNLNNSFKILGIKLVMRKRTFLYKSVSAILAVILVFTLSVPVYAQSALNLPEPGTMVDLSVSFNPSITINDASENPPGESIENITKSQNKT